MSRPHQRPSLTFAVTALCALALAISSAPLLASPASQSPRPAPLALADGCPPFPGAGAFVSRIDNRYLPLIPGATYIYEGKEDGDVQRTVVTVTSQTRTILGVDAVVVRDTVSNADGELIEDTFDWFAQDNRGNVWYLGEDSKDYENGQVVSTEGSWEAGIAGATPGIIMKASPGVGDAYRQECAPGIAEDEAAVLSLKAKVKTPLGKFGHALRTRESTPLEPGVAEDKFYAQCLGLVRTVAVQGGSGQSSLVKVKNAPSRSELGCKKKDKHHDHKHKKHKRHERRQ